MYFKHKIIPKIKQIIIINNPMIFKCILLPYISDYYIFVILTLNLEYEAPKHFLPK